MDLPRCSYDGFLQFRSRTNEKDTLVEFFCKHGKNIDFHVASSLLSIGAGMGDLDVALIKHCLPSLSLYTGVECDSENFHHLKKNLHTELANRLQNGGLRLSLHESRLENYGGPEEPPDVVLMMHLLYYFKNSRPYAIKTGMDMLQNGGRLVIGVVEDGAFLQKLANVRVESFVSWVDKISTDLQSLGLNYQEYEVQHEFDAQGCDFRFADFVLQKTASKEEVTEILEYLPKFYEPGSTRIKHATHLFIVQKQ